MEKVFVAKFNVESEAYQALSELRQEPVTNSFTVSQACIVSKKDGRLTEMDQFDTGIETDNDAGTGTLIGGLVGILGGPIGILLGASYGALIGSVVDTVDTLDNASLIEQVCGTITDNETAIIALVSEKDAESFSASLKKYHTDIIWFNAEDVADEIEKANELEEQMKKEARKQLREEKKAELKEKAEQQVKKLSDGVENLKNKLS